MFRFLCTLIFFLVSFTPNAILASGAVGVMVLPFEIHSIEDRSYLQDKIPEMINDFLKREGAGILTIDSDAEIVLKHKPLIIKDIQKMGIKAGADYVIWGSLTWVGQQYSLDVKVTETLGSNPPTVFFEQGENTESLFGAIKDLSGNISVKLFKRVKVADVVIVGNKRIEADAVKRFIRTVPGDIFSAAKISEDLKSVYAMGYFEDVRVESEDRPKGKALIFHLKEKATVRKISVQGSEVLKEEKIAENLTITPGSILNIFKIQNNIKIIESLYKEENYHNINVSYTFHELENNQVDLTFVVEEGERLRIKKIRFEGNSDYSDKELKGLMKTSEKGFFSWITSSGEYVPEDLNQDTGKLNAFYLNNGYIQARIGEPDIEFKDKWIYIKIKIFEGPRFKVGNVSVSGDVIFPEKDLLEKLKIDKEVYFSRQIIQEDILLLTDLYSDDGYAYPDISPLIDQDMKNLLVSITYNIQKGKQIYLERINISGNTKTRDKVIRRELTVYESELYGGKRIKRSVRNLHRLDFFEDVKVDRSKGSADDQIVLNIHVAEKSTGEFSFGAGYSSVENVFGMVSLLQRNLFGRGQRLQLRAEVGGVTTRYTISFTEPWLFNIPLSASFSMYDWITDYDDYDKDSKGGGVTFGYPVFDYTRAYISYSYDISDVENILERASSEIKDLEGTNITSAISATLQYDSRDRVVNPTKGSNNKVTVEYAGLAGNIGFIKYLAETGWYIPLYKDFVLFLHGKTGYIHENSGKKVPDYDRFYLGGMNSMRGFDWQDISSYDDEGDQIGGDKFLQFNFEVIIPIFKEAGFNGVVFFDTGDVYKSSEDIDLWNMRKSAGYGIRWHSPMGPIRIENGYILDPKEGEDGGGRWEFSVGTAF